jgi:GNAT superfamily N-acetyltransferase
MYNLNIGELWRLWQWLNASEARDLAEPHWHLGPVAVDPARRGEGIGSQMLRAFCARMDERGEVAFLETDKLESVRFYARCGFEVREQGEILGTPNWWMSRPVQKPPADTSRVLTLIEHTGLVIKVSESGSAVMHPSERICQGVIRSERRQFVR